MNDPSGGRRAGITQAAAAAAGSGTRHAPRYTCCVAHCGCGAQCGRRRAAGGPTRGTGSATPRWATASSAPASCSPSATRPPTRCARQAPNSCACGGGGAQATRACLRAAGLIARPPSRCLIAASAFREPMDGTAPSRVCVCVDVRAAETNAADEAHPEPVLGQVCLAGRPPPEPQGELRLLAARRRVPCACVCVCAWSSDLMLSPVCHNSCAAWL